MKKILALIAIVVVTSTGLSFAVSRWLIGCQVRPIVNIHDTAWLQRELNLSEAQRRDVERLEKDFQARLNAYCATHCAARFAMGNELMKPQPDPTKCKECVEKMNAAQAEAERATLQHILKVRSLLTDKQARRYAAIIHNQVCNMPMGIP